LRRPVLDLLPLDAWLLLDTGPLNPRLHIPLDSRLRDRFLFELLLPLNPRLHVLLLLDDRLLLLKVLLLLQVFLSLLTIFLLLLQIFLPLFQVPLLQPILLDVLLLCADHVLLFLKALFQQTAIRAKHARFSAAMRKR
jgi:hypothetical protein